MLLGCIADDMTGATDLAAVLVSEGMRTVQTIGVPPADTDPGEVDAVVVALKSRSIAAAEAVGQSLDALRYLLVQGAEQILFKYCSTFDSTPEGNIGPVADALLDALNTEQTIVCPAYPTLNRSIFRGHLFAGDRLLSESGMENHPLTPMTDPDLVRVMAAQSRRKVGLVRYDIVHRGAEAVRARLAELRAEDIAYAVTDVTDDDDLRVLGEACAGAKLVTGGSGIALGLPENFRKDGRLEQREAGVLPKVDGLEAVLAGSCSAATRGQVHDFLTKRPGFRLDPRRWPKATSRLMRPSRSLRSTCRMARFCFMPPPIRPMWPPPSPCWVVSAPVSWSSVQWASWRPGSSNVACAGLSWPAARRADRS